MDYRLFIEKEREYYSQDFTVMETLLKRIRLALINGVSVKTSGLNFTGVWDFNSKVSFTYITLFQEGLSPLRYGSRKGSIEATLNRDLDKIRESKRFSEFDIENSDKCRILLEFVIDKKLTDLKHIQEGKFNDDRFEIGINGLEAKNVFTDATAFYMPTDAVVNSHLSLSQAIRTLIKRTPIAKLTDKQSERMKIFKNSDEYELYLLRTRAFVTFHDTCVPIYRGNVLYPEFDYDILLSQFIKTSDWLIENMYDDGRFLYYYDCAEDNFKDHEHPNRKPNNLYYNDLRHCGGAITLIRAYSQTGNEKYLNAAKKAVEFTASISREHDYNGEKAYYVHYNRKGKLGGTGLALIMMMQYRIASSDKSFDEYIQGYARHLLSRMCESGELMGYYIHPSYQNGEPLVNMSDEERKATFSFYYPGEALLGLGLFMNHFKDNQELNDEVRKKSKIALDWIIDERPKLYADMFTALPSDAWLMQAIEEFAHDEEFRKENWLNFVYTDAQTMMTHMYREDETPYLDYEGGYYYDFGDHYYPDGARSEGLVAAYYLAKNMGEEALAKNILKGCKLAAKSQFSLFNCEEYTFSHKNPKRSRHAIRFKNTRQWVRVDSIQHVACFFIRLYRSEN